MGPLSRQVSLTSGRTSFVTPGRPWELLHQGQTAKSGPPPGKAFLVVCQ